MHTNLKHVKKIFRLRNLIFHSILFSLLAGSQGICWDDDMFISGFVSQGYMITSENNYITKNSKDGNLEFNEAAVNLSIMPTDRLRIGMQLFARDFGHIGNNNVYIDWAYGDYRWRDFMGFRAGKVKMPIGLYNQGREIDMLRIPIFMPQSVYNIEQSDFVLAVEGMSCYGNIIHSDFGEVDYEVFGGTLNVPDAS